MPPKGRPQNYRNLHVIKPTGGTITPRVTRSATSAANEKPPFKNTPPKVFSEKPSFKSTPPKVYNEKPSYKNSTAPRVSLRPNEATSSNLLDTPKNVTSQPSNWKPMSTDKPRSLPSASIAEKSKNVPQDEYKGNYYNPFYKKKDSVTKPKPKYFPSRANERRAGLRSSESYKERYPAKEDSYRSRKPAYRENDRDYKRDKYNPRYTRSSKSNRDYGWVSPAEFARKNPYRWTKNDQSKRYSQRRSERGEFLEAGHEEGDFEEVEVLEDRSEVPVGFRKYRIKKLNFKKIGWFKPKRYIVAANRTIVSCMNLTESVEQTDASKEDGSKSENMKVGKKKENSSKETNTRTGKKKIISKQTKPKVGKKIMPVSKATKSSIVKKNEDPEKTESSSKCSEKEIEKLEVKDTIIEDKKMVEDNVEDPKAIEQQEPEVKDQIENTNSENMEVSDEKDHDYVIEELKVNSPIENEDSNLTEETKEKTDDYVIEEIKVNSPIENEDSNLTEETKEKTDDYVIEEIKVDPLNENEDSNSTEPMSLVSPPVADGRVYLKCIPDLEFTKEFNQGPSVIQSHLDNWESHLVGLEYMIEIRQSLKSMEVKRYHCGLCNEDIVPEELDGQVVIRHIIGYRHMFNYMAKHFPSANKFFANTGDYVSNLVLQQCCEDINSKLGYHYMCISSESFFQNNAQKVKDILTNMSHWSELNIDVDVPCYYSASEFNLTNDVSELLDDLISKHLPPHSQIRRIPPLESRRVESQFSYNNTTGRTLIVLTPQHVDSVDTKITPPKAPPITPQHVDSVDTKITPHKVPPVELNLSVMDNPIPEADLQLEDVTSSPEVYPDDDNTKEAALVLEEITTSSMKLVDSKPEEADITFKQTSRKGGLFRKYRGQDRKRGQEAEFTKDDNDTGLKEKSEEDVVVKLLETESEKDDAVDDGNEELTNLSNDGTVVLDESFSEVISKDADISINDGSSFSSHHGDGKSKRRSHHKGAHVHSKHCPKRSLSRTQGRTSKWENKSSDSLEVLLEKSNSSCSFSRRKRTLSRDSISSDSLHLSSPGSKSPAERTYRRSSPGSNPAERTYRSPLRVAVPNQYRNVVRNPLHKRSRSPFRSNRSPRRRFSRSPVRRYGSPIKRSSRSPRRHSKSPRRNVGSSRRYSRSPKRRSRSPRRYSRSPKRRSRSPKRRSRSPRRHSRSPRKHSKSPRRGLNVRRSRSPFRRHSRSPKRRHSRSPIRKRSRSPIRKYSRSPEHKVLSFAGRIKSRSPIRTISRSPSTERSFKFLTRSVRSFDLSPKRPMSDLDPVSDEDESKYFNTQEEHQLESFKKLSDSTKSVIFKVLRKFGVKDINPNDPSFSELIQFIRNHTEEVELLLAQSDSSESAPDSRGHLLQQSLMSNLAGSLIQPTPHTSTFMAPSSRFPLTEIAPVGIFSSALPANNFSQVPQPIYQQPFQPAISQIHQQPMQQLHQPMMPTHALQPMLQHSFQLPVQSIQQSFVGPVQYPLQQSLYATSQSPLGNPPQRQSVPLGVPPVQNQPPSNPASGHPGGMFSSLKATVSKLFGAKEGGPTMQLNTSFTKTQTPTQEHSPSKVDSPPVKDYHHVKPGETSNWKKIDDNSAHSATTSTFKGPKTQSTAASNKDSSEPKIPIPPPDAKVAFCEPTPSTSTKTLFPVISSSSRNERSDVNSPAPSKALNEAKVSLAQRLATVLVKVGMVDVPAYLLQEMLMKIGAFSSSPPQDITEQEIISTLKRLNYII